MKPHVLVVDDDAAFAEMVATLLIEDGRVTIVGRAADGPHAVDLAFEREPEIVLMDLNLPVFDGLEATRRIRAELPDTRVLVVTASTLPEDRKRAREAGADAFLPKGVGVDAIVEAVAAVAEQQAARR
jgi:DNA-binding NarL/FixJ family response regulator